MDFLENFEKGFKWLHTKGAFLTVKSGELINTMTIAWGNIGYEWNIRFFLFWSENQDTLMNS